MIKIKFRQVTSEFLSIAAIFTLTGTVLLACPALIVQDLEKMAPSHAFRTRGAYMGSPRRLLSNAQPFRRPRRRSLSTSAILRRSSALSATLHQQKSSSHCENGRVVNGRLLVLKCF